MVVEGVKSHIPGTGVATSHLARRMNAVAVLAYIRSSGVVTVSDIMQATGLTRATAHLVCNDLLALRWVQELPSRRGPGASTGRPARRFQFASRSGSVLGVDIGEHSVKVALADLRGVPLAETAVDGLTPRTTSKTRLAHVRKLTKALRQQVGDDCGPILAAGVGVAAPVDEAGGIGFHSKSPVLYERGFKLTPGALGEATGVERVLVANDANLAVLAERWRGAAIGVDDVIALVSSERLGAGLMAGGRVLHGFSGSAGEMYFLDQVEGVGAAHGLAFLARLWADEAIGEGRRTCLKDAREGTAAPLTAEEIFSAAENHDAVACEILERLADRLARVLGVLTTLLNPELVVICGAVAPAMQPMLSRTAERLKSLTYAPPRLVCSDLGRGVVTTGAVRLALDYVEEHALDGVVPVGPAESDHVDISDRWGHNP